MRVYIFEDDPSILKMLTLYLQNKGHQVQGFLDTYSCPLYELDTCACPPDKPCAEAVLINSRKQHSDNIYFLVKQEKKGCKLTNPNKAVMSTSLTDEQVKKIRESGFSVIKKPFKLIQVEEWLRECAARLGLQAES